MVLLYHKLLHDITKKEILYLQSSATIQGKVKTQKLVVDAGAVLNGSCSMKTDNEFSFEAQANQKPTTANPSQASGAK